MIAVIIRTSAMKGTGMLVRDSGGKCRLMARAGVWDGKNGNMMR